MKFSVRTLFILTSLIALAIGGWLFCRDYQSISQRIETSIYYLDRDYPVATRKSHISDILKTLRSTHYWNIKTPRISTVWLNDNAKTVSVVFVCDEPFDCKIKVQFADGESKIFDTDQKYHEDNLKRSKHYVWYGTQAKLSALNVNQINAIETVSLLRDNIVVTKQANVKRIDHY